MDRTARQLPLSASCGALLLLLLLAPILLAVPAVAQDDVCQGYTGKSLVRTFAGPARFSEEPAESPDDLLRLLRDKQEDVRSVLEGQGLGHLTEDFFRAVETGSGLFERDVEAGDVFHWMAFRKQGEPVVIENACYSPRGERTYSAYAVELSEQSEPRGPECRQVTTTRYDFLMPKICLNIALTAVEEDVETLEAIPAPDCDVTASRSKDPSRQITVDAAGSSEEVGVALATGGSTETVIESGSSERTWTGDDPSPYGAIEVIARGQNEDRCGNPQVCEETVRLAPYERPSCTITTEPEGEQRAGRPFTLRADGHWAEDGLEVTVQRDDTLVETITHDSAEPLAEEMELRAGEYVVTGTATNVIADEATCRATVEVRGQWKLRVHGNYWDIDDDGNRLNGTTAAGATAARAATAPATDLPVREKFSVGDGVGLGVGIEYYFTDRIGLEGELEYAGIETTLVFDRGIDWALDTDDAGSFGLVLGPNFHLTPDAFVDVYLGPVIGFVDLGSVDFQTFDVGTSGSFDSEFVWGGRVGLDVPFGRDNPWGFNASARWLDLSPDVELSNPLIEGEFGIGADPVILELGLVYSF